MRNAYKSLVGEPANMRPVERPTSRKEYNVKMDLSEAGFESVGWIHLPQDTDRWRALVSTIMNLQFP
jgi:hypothetical protein